MTSPRLLGFAVAVLALAACGRQSAEQDAGAPAAAAPPAEPAAAAAPLAMAASDYVANAAVGDLYEIEAARVAQQKSPTEEVKALAEMISTDHAKSSADLQTAIAQSGESLTAPTALPADKQALIDALNAASAAAFDGLYLTQQVQAHQQALTLHQSYAQNGDAASLKAFASATAPVIQRHLDQVRQLRDRTAAGPIPAPGAAAPAAPAPKAKAPDAAAAPAANPTAK